MSAQSEFSSFKHLLKQVYSVHSSKVKELENEIKLLKEKLTEKERNNNINGDCKRCIELEEAFKACKKALYDQSKWFENFGQKFSIFNSVETENHELKDAASSFHCALETTKSSNLKKNSTLCDKNESLFEVSEMQNHEDKAEKLSVSPSHKNLLSKVIRDDCESLDVYTVTFNHNLKHNLNTKPDSMILAPDSLSTALDTKSHGENGSDKFKVKEVEKSKTLSTVIGVESPKAVDNTHQDSKTRHKRLSSETLNESRPKKVNKGDLSGNNQEISKTEENSSTIVSKFVASEPPKISENVEGMTKTTAVLSRKDVQLSKKKGDVTKATVLKGNDNEIPKNSTLTNNLVNDVKNKSISSNQTSPSLLPAQVNIPPKIIDLDQSSNDDDDFLEQNCVNKINYSEDSWDTWDRKKLKKTRNVKTIKTTSKYKMTLDAPPLNYKKPIYKQTKLSKSIFQSKSSDSNKKSPQKLKLSKNTRDSVRLEDDFSSVLQDHLQSSSPVDNRRSPVDIDATFIPEDFKLESPQYNTTKVKKNTIENSNLKNGNLFSNISFPEEVHPSVKTVENCYITEDKINDDSSDDVELKENMNSFDRLPMPEEPTYKYKNDVVRKKVERRQLNGFDCKECEKYYSELGLTAKEKKERMKKCSRHRGKYTPPATPEHFWELDFPDTEECKARGYLNATQKVNLNNIANI